MQIIHDPKLNKAPLEALDGGDCFFYNGYTMIVTDFDIEEAGLTSRYDLSADDILCIRLGDGQPHFISACTEVTPLPNAVIYQYGH